MSEILNAAGAEIASDSLFSFAGYEVVHGEFFAQLNEPFITFGGCRVTFGTACVNKLPGADFVQILVNPHDKKLVVRPCGEDDKDSFRWSTVNIKTGRNRPKRITCRLFYAKLVELMDWNPDYRYRVAGKLIQSNGEKLFVFDLKSTAVFRRVQRDGETFVSSRTPIFPIEWRDHFGVPFDEHKKSMQVNIFDGYAVFALKTAMSHVGRNYDEQL